MRWYSKSWAPLAAFLVLAVVGGYALFASNEHSSGTLYKTQLQACVRGNELRAENNRRIGAHNAERAVLRNFLATAREARREAGTPSDLRAANEYSRLLRKLDRVRFHPIPNVDCHTVVSQP